MRSGQRGSQGAATFIGRLVAILAALAIGMQGCAGEPGVYSAWVVNERSEVVWVHVASSLGEDYYVVTPVSYGFLYAVPEPRPTGARRLTVFDAGCHEIGSFDAGNEAPILIIDPSGAVRLVTASDYGAALHAAEAVIASASPRPSRIEHYDIARLCRTMTPSAG